MEPGVILVLGVAAIFGLVILGLAALRDGGKLRVTRKKLEVSSTQQGSDDD